MSFQDLFDRMFQTVSLAVCTLLFVAGCGALDLPEVEEDLGPDTINTTTTTGITMITNKGTMVIELYPDSAPKTVAQITALVDNGFYNGLTFHRVIADFMIQGGDPNGDGTGGSSLPDLPDEFNARPHVKGTISMAHAGTPNSGNSQFFICHTNTSCSHLDGKHTVFGQVVSGLTVIGLIRVDDIMTSVTLTEIQ